MAINDDKTLYESQPLVIPAQINVSEPERIMNLLEKTKGEIEELLAIAHKKPKTFMRNYMLNISTLRTILEAAENRGSQDWVNSGMKKTELSKIINRPRSSINNKLQKEVDMDSVVNAAEERHRVLAEKVSLDSIKRESAHTVEQSKRNEKPSMNPYDDSDYEVVE